MLNKLNTRNFPRYLIFPSIIFNNTAAHDLKVDKAFKVSLIINTIISFENILYLIYKVTFLTWHINKRFPLKASENTDPSPVYMFNNLISYVS